jgi:phenylacetate-CoA ligase
MPENLRAAPHPPASAATRYTARNRWSDAVTLAPTDLPPAPSGRSALRLTLEIGGDGPAGVSWYDAEGIVEEIGLAPRPGPQTVFLTIEVPGRLERVGIRCLEQRAIEVSLGEIVWLPLTAARESYPTCGFPERGRIGYLADIPLAGTTAEDLLALWSDPDFDWERYQWNRVRRLVALAWKHCRGYHRLWKAAGWHPADLTSVASLAAMPVVTKAMLREDLAAFSLPRQRFSEYYTSGSTGEPLTFRYTGRLTTVHQAAIAAAASFARPDLAPVWRRTWAFFRSQPQRAAALTARGGDLALSPAALLDRSELLCTLRGYRPEILFTWPSHACRLAETVQDDYRFAAAVVASEPLLPQQLHAIRRMAPSVVALYGLSENVTAALRCPDCGSYTALPFVGATWLKPEAHQQVGRIIGTGFSSLGTLFINYDTGDWADNQTPARRCESCLQGPGRLALGQIHGRSTDVLTDRNGRPQSAWALLSGAVAKSMPEAILYHCIQYAPGDVVIRYATSSGRKVDEEKVHARLDAVGAAFSWRLEFHQNLVEQRTSQQGTRKCGLVEQAPKP